MDIRCISILLHEAKPRRTLEPEDICHRACHLRSCHRRQQEEFLLFQSWAHVGNLGGRPSRVLTLASLVLWLHVLPDVGTGLFQYFIKLVPVTKSGGPAVEDGRVEMLTSQFAYTFKFRSMKGLTEYHRERDASVPHHHAAHGEEDGAEEPASVPSTVLPGA